MTKSAGLTDVPRNPAVRAAKTPAASFSPVPPAAPALSAIQIPKKVPTNAPIAVINCEVIACRFVKPDLIRIE